MSLTVESSLRTSEKLNEYVVFRVVMRKAGLNFFSEPIDRIKAGSLLRNQPSGMQHLEGLRKDAFLPDSWEIV